VFVHTEHSIIYVSPNGTGDGSTELLATDLQWVLTHENVIPGDTIVLLDGTYTGNFYSTITGVVGEEIIIKPKNYLQAIIDGSIQIGDFGGINGAYTIIRNVIGTNSDTDRGTWETPQGTISRTPNIFPAAPNVGIINCIYHDGGVGIPGYEVANNLILYGNLVYNNGWADDNLGGAECLYLHSTNKTVKHNIFGGAFKRSVAVYTTNGTIDDITLEENVVFARSTLLMGGNASDGEVILGSLIGNHVINNGIQLGYTMTPNITAICNNNRVYGDNPLTASYFQYLTVNGNKFSGKDASGNACFELNYTTEKIEYLINNNEYHNVGIGGGIFNPGGTFAGWQALGYDADGSYSTILPTINEVFVYPNEYPDEDDKRMGIIVIWNWEEYNSVAVDLIDLELAIGDTYRWRQAQDPLVDIGTFVFDGNPVSFGMTAAEHSVAYPIGFDELLIESQFPVFGTFIIEKV